MVIQRLGMCMELVRLAIQFVMVVAEAVGVAIQQNGPPQQTYPGSETPVAFNIAFLP